MGTQRSGGISALCSQGKVQQHLERPKCGRGAIGRWTFGMGTDSTPLLSSRTDFPIGWDFFSPAALGVS